jgi:hypothetical protein
MIDKSSADTLLMNFRAAHRIEKQSKVTGPEFMLNLQPLHDEFQKHIHHVVTACKSTLLTQSIAQSTLDEYARHLGVVLEDVWDCWCLTNKGPRLLSQEELRETQRNSEPRGNSGADGDKTVLE